MKRINTTKIKSGCLALLLSLAVIGCSTPNNLSTNISDQNISIFKVSDNHSGEINFKINVAENTGMSIKATKSGSKAKTSSNIDHFVVYLIKNTSTTGFPVNVDPLDSNNIVMNKDVTKSISGVRFTGVPALTTGAYYVAVRAVSDLQGTNDLIKAYNGATGTTWTGNNKVAISNGAGITLGSDYVISQNSLAVTVNLADGVGAQITGQATITAPSVSPTISDISNKYTINTIAGNGTQGIP